jgi:hypothetical protein
MASLLSVSANSVAVLGGLCVLGLAFEPKILNRGDR